MKFKCFEVKYRNLKLIGVFVFFLLIGNFSVLAQQVKSSVDTSAIKIGEKITYNLQVQADSSSQIKWPKRQTFLPLEVFDSTAIDTFYKKDIIQLKRQYALTQFDSGAYTIPQQKILINGREFLTDSFQVKVHDVVVDTTKQKLYPIKPALDIDVPMTISSWVWWLIGILVVLGILVFVFLKARKKIIEKRRELPPYEKAIQNLKKLDESQSLENGKVKAYYSSLSETIKRYIDEKVGGRALESTTSEFIELLKSYEKEKQIYLKKQVIDSIAIILNRADLAKFAGVRTDKLTAKEDRQTIEDNINAFDQAVPEPTEEEKLQNEIYRIEKERRQKKRKRMISIAAGVLVLLIASSVFVGVKGLDYTKDLFSSTSTTKLLKSKDWITSQYGQLGMTLTTPKVLVRNMDSLPEIFPGESEVEEHFSYGSHAKNFYIEAVNVGFKKDSKIDTLRVEELLDKAMASKDIENMTFKHQDFSTLQDKKGQKVFGTFKYQKPNSKSAKKKAYTFLLFNENGGLQELLITYNEDDKVGAELEERIVNSVEFKTGNKHD